MEGGICIGKRMMEGMDEMDGVEERERHGSGNSVRLHWHCTVNMDSETLLR